MPYISKVSDIEARIQNLATTYPAICTRIECAHKTYEGGTPPGSGRTVAYLRIGTGTGGGRPRILIVAGVHARELAPPDAVLTFTEKLLSAYKNKRPITYKKFLDSRKSPTILYKQFTIPFSPDVQQIIEKTELYVLPLANPDGRAFIESGGFSLWRKNRRPAPPGTNCPGLPAGLTPDGVDLNRNFDIGWDFKNFYSAAFLTAATQAVPPATLGVSDDICDPGQTFHGPKASPRVREPEVQNIVDLITTVKINFYMDVHSFAGQLLFPWGLAPNQETTPANSFVNTDLDQPSGSGRDPSGTPPSYAEWLPPGTEARHKTLGTLMRDKIQDSTGYTAADTTSSDARKAQIASEARKRSLYPAIQSIFSFSTSVPDLEPGGSDDFAFSQQVGANAGPPITAKALDPVFSFTFECGRSEDGGFQPLPESDPKTEYPKIEREVGMGLATYLSFAATWKAPVPAPPPGPSPSPPKSEPGLIPICFVATACYGSPQHPAVAFLCELRDREVKATELGRRFMRPVEHVYYRFGPHLAMYLRRHQFMRITTRLFVVGPVIFLIRRCAAVVCSIKPQERRVRWLLISMVGAGLGVLSTGAALLAFLARTLLTK